MSKKSELESRVGRLAEPEILKEGVELVDVEFVREGKVQCLRVLTRRRNDR